MSYPWFKLYFIEFLSDFDIDALSLEEKGMLLVLWCHCAKKGRFPADLKQLSKIFKMTSKKTARRMENLMQFFLEEHDETGVLYLYSRRMREEMENYNEKMAKLRENGKLGGRPKKPFGSDLVNHLVSKSYPDGLDLVNQKETKSKAKQKQSETYKDKEKDLLVSLVNLPEEKKTACLPAGHELGGSPALTEPKTDRADGRQAEKEAGRQAGKDKSKYLRTSGEEIDQRVIAELRLSLSETQVHAITAGSPWGTKGLWALIQSFKEKSKGLESPAGALYNGAMGKTDVTARVEYAAAVLERAGWFELPSDGTAKMDRFRESRIADLGKMNLIPLDLAGYVARGKIQDLASVSSWEDLPAGYSLDDSDI
jgi:uncharacterized protein YdaU (DUF1376 family)